ncbi:MAG: Gfo/Idh/MocA family oxidoreductase [Spirochaetes bacterium]|nr:Gfo/Idh/MocA family oxidoreductase [Spirochaetota bacterium]
MAKTGVGIIGCGAISGIYLKNLTQKFDSTRVVACADLLAERAKAAAAEYKVAKASTVDELLRDPEVEIVLNLTIPRVHAEVSLAAIAAGKHVYSEKPLAVSRADGARVLEAARRKGRRLGGAPDTFLGGGIQTCRKIIDDGLIGRPIGATAFMTTPGHERWHPDPEFYYQPGGGPMLDMGPYYLTALVTLMGPIARVAGSAQTTYPERTITSEPKHGQKIKVEVPTHVAGVLDFASGAVGMILTSFDVWGTHLPAIEIYGTDGSLSVPDPNTFGGPVLLLQKNEKEWREVPLAFGYAENSRGLGVADMADAIAKGRPHRAAGEAMYHVLDVMEGLHDASAAGRSYMVKSGCERSAALPLGLADGEIG